MERKGISKTLKLVIAAALVLVVGFLAYSKLMPKDNSVGKITIAVIEMDGTVAAEKEVKFTEEDNLISLVQNNFENVVIEDGFLYSIETLTTPADWSSFICIYVNDVASEVGIAEIELSNGIRVSFVDTELNY